MEQQNKLLKEPLMPNIPQDHSETNSLGGSLVVVPPSESDGLSMSTVSMPQTKYSTLTGNQFAEAVRTNLGSTHKSNFDKGILPFKPMSSK